MEKDLVRTKLSPDALSVIARAAGRTIPKIEPKKVPSERHRADDALQNNAEHGSVDTLIVQGTATDKARLPSLPGTIPDSPNGFLSNTLHTLILQVHHETIVAILLWLTRAGLQGRLQGLRQFEISAHESMSIMTSKGKRYVPVPASTASNQVHAGVLHDFWAVFPGLEVCALHAVQITDDQTEISNNSSRSQGSPKPTTTGLGGANTSGALTTQQAYQIKRGHIARCGRHPGYLSEVVSTLATIHRLTSQDPSLGISTITQLHLKECDSLSSFRTLLSRLPHLAHLTVQRLQSSEQLQVLTELCPKLSHFSYMGQPERGPTTVLEWGAFFKATASTLQELFLQNVQVTDQDLRILARRCGATLRVLSVVQGSNTTACSWQGTKAVLENCRVLESCTLSCYGPVDGLFVHDPEFEAVQEDEEEEEEKETGVAQGIKAWACRETLQTLCLYGLVFYNAATNHRLFERLCTLRRLRVLTITGRGMSLEALLGPQRLVGSASVEGASHALEAHTTATTTPSTRSMYPCLESIDLPRLTKRLTSEDLLALLQALPRLRWMDVGGAYEVEALIWLETERRDLLTTFSR